MFAPLIDYIVVLHHHSDKETAKWLRIKSLRNPRERPGNLHSAHFLQLSNDSTPKILLVAVVVCLFCSILVSTAAVTLKPFQDHNQALDKKKNLLEVSGLQQPGKPVEVLFEPVTAKVVDLSTGDYVNRYGCRSI